MTKPRTRVPDRRRAHDRPAGPTGPTGPAGPAGAQSGLPSWPVILALAPLLLSVLWLPLIEGGAARGALALAEGLTFASVAVLGVTGRLPRPSGNLARVTVVLAAAALAAAVSTAFSLDLDAGVPALLRWLWLTTTAALVVVVAQDRRTLPLVAWSLVLALGIQTFWGFFVWWGGGSPGGIQSGTFYSPNQYAGYLLLLAPLPLVLALTSRSSGATVLWGTFAAVVMLGLALSGSRGGAVAAAAGVVAAVFLLARGRSPRLLRRALAVGALFLVLGIFLTGPIFLADIETQLEGGPLNVLQGKGTEAITLEMRVRWAQGALEIGGRRPLTGWGLGTFGEMFMQVQEPEWQWSRYAHNQYLEAFADGGVPLALAVIALPVVALASAWPRLGGRAANSDHSVSSHRWQIGLWAGLVGASAHLVVDHDWSFPGYQVTYVVVALLLVAPWDGPQPAPGAGARRITRVGIIAGAAAALCAATVGSGYASGYFVNRQQDSLEVARERETMALRLAPYSTLPARRLAFRLLNSGGAGGEANLREAAALLESAVSRDRLDPWLRWDLAGVEIARGRLDAARDSYRQAIRLSPNAPRSYGVAAEFELEAANDPAVAARILDEGISRLRRRPSPERTAVSISNLLLLRSLAEEKTAGPRSAVEYVWQAAAAAPGNLNAWYRLGQLACALEDPALLGEATEGARAAGASQQILELFARLREGDCTSSP